MKYVLDECGVPRKVDDVLEWGRWFETSGERRRVGFRHLGRCYVSTVFLALDHSFGLGGPPLLFETMVFRASDHESLACYRWPTLEQAERGHALAVQTMRKGIPWSWRLVGWIKTLAWWLHRYEYDWASRRLVPI